MRYFLGVDTGATKSHALIADENGRSVGFGAGGPGNWETIGWGGTRQVLTSITQQALNMAGIDWTHIAGAGFGLAGYDWPEDGPPHEEIIRSLGVAAPFGLVNDSMIGLLAGSTAGWGVGVAAGTSCNCYGRSRNGRIGRLTGSSWFGEYAGASELTHRALQAISRAWSLRGPATQLSQTLVEMAGAKDVDDLLAGLMRERYHLPPATARQIFAVAAAGDAVAQELVVWAGQELGDLVNGVARQLQFEAIPFEVVMSGSLFQAGEPLITPLRQTVLAVAPQASFRFLDAPPVIGGVVLGMQVAGLETAKKRQQLIETANQVIRQFGN